jgi:hypothetical protein
MKNGPFRLRTKNWQETENNHLTGKSPMQVRVSLPPAESLQTSGPSQPSASRRSRVFAITGEGSATTAAWKGRGRRAALVGIAAGAVLIVGGSSPASRAGRFGERGRARGPGAEFISIEAVGAGSCIAKVGLVDRYHSYRELSWLQLLE